MWYLKVSSSLLIAVALICMIQNAISITIDPQAPEDKWSTLESSTDHNDLKKISKLCKNSLNNFNEKFENTKTNTNKKLLEPNKTTEDITNLVNEIKTQLKNASVDLVTVRKLVQKTALRFRDTFKSLVSYTELENDSVNKELESIKKTAVDSKKPLVNSVVRSFGNRYDLIKLANKVLEITSDHEKLKNNYDEKKKNAKREFNSLWNSVSYHSKTVNDNALKALDTFFEGMESLKKVKKKVKAVGEDALGEIKKGNDIIKLKNAVELAKALKLKFEDEWNLDSGELTYSDELKKPNTQVTDENQSDVQGNEQDMYENENISVNDIQPSLPKTEQETIENDKANIIPTTQDGIEKHPMDNIQTSDKAVSPIEETQLTPEQGNKDKTKIMQPTISETENGPMDSNVPNTIYSPIKENPLVDNTENKDKTVIVQPEVSNKDQNSINDDDLKSASPVQEISLNPDINNNKATQLKEAADNKRGTRPNPKNRERTSILPWEKLIQLDTPQISQQSRKCKNLLNNVTTDFDNIKKTAKNSIQRTKNYENLQEIENDTVKQFYDKMVDTNTKLCDNLVNAAEDVCAEVSPMNKKYETKFKNDPNIKRIKYLIGKQYDPNQYILKILDDASHKNGISGIKKTTYYKMLAVAHNLKHETQEMENAALYAMNKINEGKIAATNLKKKFNKEKASKACYIKNILLEQENENDKMNKDENKEKVKESLNEDTNTEPLKQDVNLDSVDAIQPTTVNDDNEPTINNNEETKQSNETDESTNTKIPEHTETEKNDFNEDDTPYGEITSVTPKVKRRRKIRNPIDGIEISEEYEVSEEDENNLIKPGEKQFDKKNDVNSSDNADNKHDTEIPEQSETEKDNSNEENSTHKEDDEQSTSVTPKVKRSRKIRNPIDGIEISEEYEVSEEDENNLSKPGEKQFDKNNDVNSSDNADNKHDTEIPEQSETEKDNLNEEKSTHEEDDEESTSVTPKLKRSRKIRNPIDGIETTEEYEVSEEDENNLNKSGEKQFEKNNDVNSSDNADTEHDTEIPEQSETEKDNLNEEKSTHEEDDEESTSVTPKVKRSRKIRNPIDGIEISEEYEVSEEDENNLNKSGEKQFDKNNDVNSSDNADNEHDTEIPEQSETQKDNLNDEKSTHEEDDKESTSVTPKVKRSRKIRNPIDGIETSEEYEVSEEDENNLNKSGEKQFEKNNDVNSSDNADTEHDTAIPEKSETEKDNSNEENSTHEEDDDQSTSVTPKVKRSRKIRNPIDGIETSEEYEVSEEDENNFTKSGVTQSDKNNDVNSSDNADNEHDTEIPEQSETEKDNLNEEKSTHEEDDEESTSVTPKVKRSRKIRNPIDGIEISEEYEVSEEDENKLNKSGETKSDENKDLNSSDNADTEHDTEILEKSETEKDNSNEENSTHEEDDDQSTSVTPKVKRSRKIRNPIDGIEISEEYEVSEEDENKLNNSGETKSDENKDLNSSDNADTEHDTEIPEKSETEKDNSNEENSTHEEDDDQSTSVTPKVKRSRKIRNPIDGIEISEEYEVSEEDENNLNKSGEKQLDKNNDVNSSDNADNEHDTEIPEQSETQKDNLNDEKSTHEEDDEESTSVTPKVKRSRKIRNPIDGIEISEEYEVSEEDENNLNKSGETQSDKNNDLNSSDNADNEHDTEIPEQSETQKDNLNDEKSTHEEDDEESTSVTPKVKRSRKIRNPIDGIEISEEYEVSEEDANNLNKSGETQSDKNNDLNSSDNADNEHDTEIPEQSQTEKENLNEENSTHEKDDEESTSVKPNVKRRRKVRNSIDGIETSEEYEVSEEDKNNLNKSGETKSDENNDLNSSDNADNEHDTEIPEQSETEKDNLNEENSTHKEDDEQSTSVTPKVKRSRKIRNLIDGIEMSEEYEVSEEEENRLNKSNEENSNTLEQENENKSNEMLNEVLNSEFSDNPLDKQDKGKNDKNIINKYDNTESNDDMTFERSRDLKSPKTVDNVGDKNPENVTREAVDLEENENLNSLDDEKMNCVHNDNILPSAESMGEDSSEEANYEERYFKDPKDGKEIIEKYDTSEEQRSPEIDQYTNTPAQTPEVVNDENIDNNSVEDRGVNSTPSYGYNDYDTIPESENREPTDIDNEIEQPESYEYPENAIETPEDSPADDVDETTNNARPRPRKDRRHRKSRKPKSVKENENNSEVVNDENIDNNPVEDQGVNSTPSYGYNDNDYIPESENREPTDIDNEIEQPESYEYPENAIETPEDSPADDVDETTNNARPRPRKDRRQRKSRKPKSVKENENNPEVVNDENIDNNPVEDQGVNSTPSYGYNDYDNIPESENREPTDIDNEIEQPESYEYPENAIETPEDSPADDVDETTNNARPRPRKDRRHRKSRKPKSVKENENNPEVVNDENIDNNPVEDQGVNSTPSYGYNDYDNIPESENREPTDIDNEIEQPESYEYPENAIKTPEDSPADDVGETTNNGRPRPRKDRRHRKSRKPKSVKENENNSEVVNDENIDNNPVEDQGVNSTPSYGYNDNDYIPESENREPTDIDNEIEQPESYEYPENAIKTPEDSPADDVGETTNNARPRPRKDRRQRKSRKPKSVKENENNPEVVNDENIDNNPVEDQGVNSTPSYGYNDYDNIPESENREPTDIDNEIEQPESYEYPENAIETPEDSPADDVDETTNNARPRPRKDRRHRKSRKPKSVKENENNSEVVNDENIDNNPVEDQGVNSTPSYGYNDNDYIPESENREPTDIDNEIEQPESYEYPENAIETPEDSPADDVDETTNNARPRPRKDRRHRKSRKPKSVKENENNSEVVNDENINNYPVEYRGVNSQPTPSYGYNDYDTIPESENREPTDIDNEIEQPESYEYPENAIKTPEDSPADDVGETTNNARPRPRKDRRHRKSRKPKSVKENENNPEVVNDENIDNNPVEDQGVNSTPSYGYNDYDNIPESENREPTDIDNEIEQPESYEYPENAIKTPEDSPADDVGETTNNARPRPRKDRRHRKSRKPKSVKENENNPEVVNDENIDNNPVEDQGVNSTPSYGYNDYDTIPESENREPTDIDNEIEQPESYEYPENAIETPEDSPADDVDETTNNARPRPRKDRRHRKSRKPKSVKENENNPEVVNDENIDNNPVEDQGVNSTPSYGYNDYDNIPESENREPTDIDNEIEQPESYEYPENAIETPEDSPADDVDETTNNARPRPRKDRRHRKSRKPKSVKENENNSEVVNDENIDNNPVEDQGVNSTPSYGYNDNDYIPESENREPTDIDNEIEQPESYEYPENAIETPEDSPADDVDETTNNARPRPRKDRRQRKSRKPKSVKENENNPEVVNDENIDNNPVEDQGVNSTPSYGYNDYDNIPESENREPTDIDNEIEQPESYEYPENAIETPEDSPADDVDETTNNARPRPRKDRRHRKSRKPKSVKENENNPEVVNDENIDNNPVEDQGVNSTPSYGYNDYDNIPESENREPTDIDNEIEQPESYEYPENAIKTPEDSPADDVGETTNNGRPRPRKDRRHRKSRKPKSVKENENNSEVVNDENIDNNPVEDQGVNSTPSYGYNDNDYIPESENREPTDIDNEIEQPESYEYPENAIKTPEDSPADDVGETTNNARPRPRKDRRQRKSRKPKSVKENENNPEVVNDENIDNNPVEDQGVNSTPSYGYNDYDNIPESENREPTDIDNEIEQPESYEYPENAIETPEDSPADDVDETTNNARPRPRKDRRHRKSRKPKSVKENENNSEVVNDENIDNNPVEDQGVNSTPSYGYNDNDYIPESENREPTDIDNEIEQPESYEYPENAIETPEDSPADDVDETTNNARPRPRKDRRHRKSRKPKSVKENENNSEVVNDENINNYPVEYRGVNSQPTPSYGYNDYDTIPESENREPTDIDNEIEQPESYEYPENAIKTPEDSPADDVGETTNNARPRPRKDRRHRKSRKPKSVKENENNPEVVNDENIDNNPVEDQGVNSTPSYGYNDYDNIPESENREPTDIDNEIEQPESYEYPENAIKTPEDSPADDVGETTNNARPRPRKDRRHRKSRKPKSVKENENNPEVVNDENIDNNPVEDQGVNSTPSYGYNDYDTIPESENREPTDIDNEIEQPESYEYPENAIETPEDSPADDVDETTNNARPRPRKDRRHRKSRKPKSVKENENNPEVVNDENIDNNPVEDQGVNSTPSYGYNDYDNIPESENREPTDIDNEIEQPESYEYPENAIETPEDSPADDVDETTNNARPRPRKDRRHRKSRKPKSVKENENNSEVVNDENINNYPVEYRGVNSQPTPSYGYNDYDNIPESENREPTDIDNEIEQPESYEYPENAIETTEDSPADDIHETTNIARPRPRKGRRHRKSRKPKSVKENENKPEVVNDENINNYPVEYRGVNSQLTPSYGYNDYDNIPESENREPTDIDNEIEQPESYEYPENAIETPEDSPADDVDETTNNARPRPRKDRRHRKSRKPKSVKENEYNPEVVNDENIDNNPVEDQGVNSTPLYGYNDYDNIPESENREPTDIDNEIEQPESYEYPENAIETPEDSPADDVDETTNNARPRPRKDRRHRKSRKPKSVKENENNPEVVNDENIDNNPIEDRGVNSTPTPLDAYNDQENIPETDNGEATAIDVDETVNNAKPRPRKVRHLRKSRKPKLVDENENVPDVVKDENIDNHPVDVNDKDDSGINEKPAYINETDGIRIPDKQPNDAENTPKKKRRVRRLRTYMVNRATNERIPINDQTYSTTDGLPDTLKNELESTELEDSDDPDTNEDNDDYSSFLFKEYNSDQCKRDAYDRFKKVTSQDAKQIAYRSVLDTSEMRSNMLATIKNAIGNVKVSKTFNDVDQSLRTVSFSLKTSLKQTVSDLVTKVKPLAKDFLTTAENLKELYKNGPQSTHKMLSNILDNESTVPDSAKDVLKLISPQFDVDKLINNIFDKPFNAKTLKEKKAKAQRKLITLSKNMDTAISNIDCFVLSAMSAVGIGADTLKLLKSGRVIMSDKHPKAKALRDAVGIIKAGKKIRNNDVGFAPELTSNCSTENDEDDDDEDPDEVAQKDEEFLKTVPDLDDNMPVPKKVPNKRQSLGVIVVHPDKQIEYKEVNDTSQLKKFIGDQTKKYKFQSTNKHPKFLKLNSKKLIDNMVEDVKKKAERNGMSNKEMVQEIINNLKSN